MKKRITIKTSRTAEWACICRAASSLEKNPCLKGGDTIALQLLPSPIKTLIQIPWYRVLHCRVGAPKGIYAYIIARTRYFDAVYQQAPANRFDQIAILGAGFDTRAVRFPVGEGPTMVYELDSRCTQNTKLSMYTRNAIPLPPYMKFGAIDFETESLQEKLEGIGFLKKRRCLFILEGVSMYLKPESVHDMFLSMIDFMGRQSLIAFDYIYADVLRHEKKHYGETEIMNSVSRVKEAWQFGIERNALPQFLSRYNLQLVNHMSARDIEQTHFRNDQGKIIRRVNATHCCAIVEN